MIEITQDVFIKGLEGHYSHISPEKALADLNSELANKNIEGFPHSIWDLLHHMATWQEVVIASITGKEIDWDNITQNKNWPTEESKKLDANFDKLLTKFKEDFQKVEDLVKSVDFSKPIASWQDNPVMQALMVAITHNSYHLGQIMVLKKNLINKD
ncbi:MAG: DinB family protein [Candidatus Heimdallarchaeota archaeon]|nr:DinB family protein [Candidatus Heimdallarchaeota archaeon]MCK4769333.1 DinB family protein [Candidatus Heimdallarchaeota archaeon]